MMIRKCLVSAAAAVLTIGSVAWADEPANTVAMDASSQNVTIPAQQPLFADDAPAPRAPLMALLDKIGVAKTMDDWNLNLAGYVEEGYTYDMTVPKPTVVAKNGFPGGDDIAFGGNYKDSPILDQVDLALTRTVDASKGKFDVGFRVEGIWGKDATLIHSDGILDNSTKHGGGEQSQLDLEQAYLQFAIPVGTGLTITAGKFVTPMGYETINPTTNPFYSHSYLFTYGIPLTQTGVYGTYNLSDKLTVNGGITRGWNQSTDDNNSAIDGLVWIAYTGIDKLTLNALLSFGPEGVLPYGPGDEADYWTVPELNGQYKLSDELTLGFDLLYGDAPNSSPGGSPQWYSAAGYLSYTINKYVTANARGEFYYDGLGFTTGTGVTTDYEEFTVGASITPLPDDNIFKTLTIRPEVRYDLSSPSAYDPGTGSPHDSEVTFAVDVLWQY